MERKEMEFGKRFRAGNFEYVKKMKTLSKREVSELRDQAGIPQDVRKHLTRGGLPYITVSAISGAWSVTFSCTTAMYNYIEFAHFSKEGSSSMHNLFVMMFADTTIMGDQEYWSAKSEALKAFMERQKANVSKEDDDKELEALKTEFEARENIKEAAKELSEQEGDGDAK